MTREEKINLLNKLLEIEEKLDIGNLTRAEKGEFRQWVEALEQGPCDECEVGNPCLYCKYGFDPQESEDKE